MSSDGYMVVGVHGPPTKETAPHGFRWSDADGDRWRCASAGTVILVRNDTKWQPLPAPLVEQAPAPEPVARWRPYLRGDGGWGLCEAVPGDSFTADETIRCADALNTLDRDGAVYGPGRPMEALPNGHLEPVLIGYDGVIGIDHRTDRENDEQYDRRCWWPLPESGE